MRTLFQQPTREDIKVLFDLKTEEEVDEQYRLQEADNYFQTLNNNRRKKYLTEKIQNNLSVSKALANLVDMDALYADWDATLADKKTTEIEIYTISDETNILLSDNNISSDDRRERAAEIEKRLADADAHIHQLLEHLFDLETIQLYVEIAKAQ